MTEYALDKDRLVENDIAIREDGSLYIPPEIIRQAGFRPGDAVRLMKIDDELNVVPRRLVVSQMAAEISHIMKEEGVTIEDLLSGLEEAREAVFRETYGNASASEPNR